MKRITTVLMMCAVPALVMGMESNDTDELFFKGAAEGGLAEVAAGKLAEDKATGAALRDFAGMMVKDHSTADTKLWRLASGQSVSLPTTASVEQMAANTKLKLLSGQEFDKAYIRNQIDAHRETIALLKKELASGKDPRAKEFAAATLPTVQGHLDKIEQIAKAAGVD